MTVNCWQIANGAVLIMHLNQHSCKVRISAKDILSYLLCRLTISLSTLQAGSLAKAAMTRFGNLMDSINGFMSADPKGPEAVDIPEMLEDVYEAIMPDVDDQSNAVDDQSNAVDDQSNAVDDQSNAAEESSAETSSEEMLEYVEFKFLGLSNPSNRADWEFTYLFSVFLQLLYKLLIFE